MYNVVSFKVFYSVKFSLQTLSVNLFQTGIWLSKQVVKHVWLSKQVVKHVWANRLSSMFDWVIRLSSMFDWVNRLSSMFDWVNRLSSMFDWVNRLSSMFDASSNNGKEFDRCLDCQICVWNSWTDKIWSEFEGKNGLCKCTFT